MNLPISKRGKWKSALPLRKISTAAVKTAAVVSRVSNPCSLLTALGMIKINTPIARGKKTGTNRRLRSID
ncbi:hypothetical protein ES707_12287 [subsurface metagenome]